MLLRLAAVIAALLTSLTVAPSTRSATSPHPSSTVAERAALATTPSGHAAVAADRFRAQVSRPAAPPAKPAAKALRAAAPARTSTRATTAVPPAVVTLHTVEAAMITASPTNAVQGADISWPNCPKSMGHPHGYDLPMPRPQSQYVVLGATNGPAFTKNPCLASQRAWAQTRRLPVAAYAVVHFPNKNELRRYGGRGTYGTMLRRVGAAEAQHALITLRQAGVPAHMVWIDVETVGGHPWSGRASANRALLQGVMAGYAHAHVSTGIYSYSSAWRQITASLRLTRVPTWVPSGGTQYASAVARCRQASFSGGRVLMTQWTDFTRDYDITCPGVATASNLRALFTQA